MFVTVNRLADTEQIVFDKLLFMLVYVPKAAISSGNRVRVNFILLCAKAQNNVYASF